MSLIILDGLYSLKRQASARALLPSLFYIKQLKVVEMGKKFSPGI